ncbi:MAG: retroviral-like aspartic protease family protein [Chloroherpetonaceae bacterium]|nr:retroviral-like aspartic protease family protein [Chthonomonadaceae bacterium]MDW8208739.1 retroviral-like aspartic protease family protein [Chloroherpetonaceae bacterium]
MLFSLILLALGGLPGPLPAAEPKVVATYRVPYRLSETRHLLVRARLNGKGPFHFIVDTGAPMLFVAQEIADRLGIRPGPDRIGTVERLQLEGGLILTGVAARIEDPVQLRGMNAMGLAETKLDGVLGYNVLARFRMEIDLTRPDMVWHLLDYVPPAVRPIAPPGRETQDAPAAMADMERLVNMARLFFSRQEVTVRQGGFVGIELSDGPGGVTVRAVLPGSPAAQAGMAPGDHVRAITTPDQPRRPVRTVEELQQRVARILPGKSLRFEIERSGRKREIVVTAGPGGF